MIVKKSRIPNAGKGLFAEKNYNVGDLIIEFSGDIFECEDDLITNDTYAFDDYITCLEPDKKGLARFVNHSSTPNTDWKEYDHVVEIIAIKPIRSGEEFVIDYGGDYDYEIHGVDPNTKTVAENNIRLWIVLLVPFVFLLLLL